MKNITELEDLDIKVVDSRRRDLSINSLMYDPIKDILYDFNDGAQDIKDGLIKFVGDPKKRIIEDPLRILRAIRFAHRYDFIIDDNTYMIMEENKDLIRNVSKERIYDEMKKASDNLNMKHFINYIKIMRDLGAFYFIKDIYFNDYFIKKFINTNVFTNENYENKIMLFFAQFKNENFKKIDFPFDKSTREAIIACQNNNWSSIEDDYLYFEYIYTNRYKKEITEFYKVLHFIEDNREDFYIDKIDDRVKKFKDIKKEINGRYIMEKYGVKGKEVGEKQREEIRNRIKNNEIV